MQDKTSEAAYRVDVDDAQQLIDSRLPEYPSRSVRLDEAAGQVLRQKVTAERDQPPFDRVTMDGIAVDSQALAQDLRDFMIAGNQAAGEPVHRLPATGACIEIMTGAMLPIGTDTVIPIERITRKNDRAIVDAAYEVTPGQFVHARGSDHPKGQTLLEEGTVIRAPEMAILTAAGSPVVEVAEWPTCAVISTGDELVDVGDALEAHQIRSSNDRAIEAALISRGCLHCLRAHVPDAPKELLEVIGRLHEKNDLLILSGGVSMGKYDYVPAVLEKLGVELVFHKVLQRPGLPMWFGVSNQGKPVFALPGNPVSTLVCLYRYVIPGILKSLGAKQTSSEQVRLAEAVEFEPDLTWFLPATLSYSNDGATLAHPRPTNTSGDFIGLRGTDGFVELSRGHNLYPAGLSSTFYRW